MRSDDDEQEQRPAEDDAERPDDAEPWAKTSSGDADSVVQDDDE